MTEMRRPGDDLSAVSQSQGPIGTAKIEEEASPPTHGVSVKHARNLFRSGLLVSAAYIVGMAIYAWCVRGAMLAMKPADFADFLAGVFAPLAFLWLVLGFRQQGDELKNSARALWLQGEELRNSVEQQRQLVEVSREQLNAETAERRRLEDDADRAAQPNLTMGFGGVYRGPVRDLKLTLASAGPSCSDVRVMVNDTLRGSKDVLPEGHRLEMGVTFQRPAEVRELNVKVEYIDRRGHRRAQRFIFPVDPTGGPDGDRTLGTPKKEPGYEKVD